MSSPIVSGDQWFVVKPVLEASITAQLVLLGVMSALAIIAVAYAVRICLKEKQLYPLYIFMGAGFASFYEPLGDLLAHVTYAEEGQINYIISFGFQVPVWVVPTYMAFFAFPVIFILQKAKMKITVKWWTGLMSVAIIGCWVLEVPLLALGFVEYYGQNAPVKIFDYPVWMGFANAATMAIVTTAIYFYLKSSFGREHSALVVFLFPLFFIAGNAGSGYPVAFALNSSESSNFVNLMAVGSMCLSTLFIWICGNLIISASGGK